MRVSASLRGGGTDHHHLALITSARRVPRLTTLKLICSCLLPLGMHLISQFCGRMLDHYVCARLCNAECLACTLRRWYACRKLPPRRMLHTHTHTHKRIEQLEGRATNIWCVDDMRCQVFRRRSTISLTGFRIFLPINLDYTEYSGRRPSL